MPKDEITPEGKMLIAFGAHLASMDCQFVIHAKFPNQENWQHIAGITEIDLKDMNAIITALADAICIVKPNLKHEYVKQQMKAYATRANN